MAVFLASAAVANAQSITGLSAAKNAGNSADEFSDGTFVSYQRTSTVGVVSATSTHAQIRYQSTTATDSGIFNSRTESLNSDYTVSFSVTAPGAYLLHISTSLNGAFTLVDDGTNSGHANASAVTGTQTGGAIDSGSISLADPGQLDSNSGGNTAFNPASTAVISALSNGAAIAHTLKFTWNTSCASDSGFTGGDECAVRLGIVVTYTGQTAGNYPGVGSRVQAADGHFVSVDLESLCGNGTVDSGKGEQCDESALNGSASSCCTSTCQFRAAASVCRASAGACDVQEVCTGASGTCPANSVLPNATICRAAAGVCDLIETCNGVSDQCPADGKSTAVCRAATDVCDAAESCNGVANTCPADAAQPAGTVCRAAAGVCDITETCNGVSFACPADVVSPASTVCRAAAGVCDLAENCDGSSVACPADVKSTAVCRPAVGICDEAEVCDGMINDCHPDAFLGSGGGAFICRPVAGVCDVPDACDGSGINCPADVVLVAGTICRGSGGVCDIAEVCDGTTGVCPADGFQPATAVCRAVAGVCDVADNCPGTGPACTADAKSTAQCRAAAGVCDLAENCNGVSNTCPADGFKAPTTVCRAAANGCDIAENCSGSAAACPADQVQADGDGDLVCDALDNCPAVANAGQADADGDLVGDSCDICTGGAATTKTKLIISKLATAPGDDKLKFRGEMQIPSTPAYDLVNKGARLQIVDNVGTIVIDATLPAGAYNPAQKVGWKKNSSSTTFKYQNKGTPVPLVNGIYKIAIKHVVATPGRVKFVVAGKTGSYPVITANLPVHATIVIEGPLGVNGECGASSFPGPAPLPACLFNGSTVRCK